MYQMQMIIGPTKDFLSLGPALDMLRQERPGQDKNLGGIHAQEVPV